MKRALTCVVIALMMTTTTEPEASEVPWVPELSMHAGIPFYFSFYGRSPDPEESTLAFAGHLGADASWPVWFFVRAGISVDGGYVSGDISGVDGYVYSVAIGPTVIVESHEWTGEWFNVALSFAPSLLVYGTVADENLQKHSQALGIINELSIRLPFSDHFSLGLFGGLGLFGSPLSDGVWFNEALGRTNTAYVSLGISFRP